MDLNSFFNKVSYYLYFEYDAKYHYNFSIEVHSKKMTELVKSYYWGGNNVPDTARAVVDYFRNLNNANK